MSEAKRQPDWLVIFYRIDDQGRQVEHSRTTMPGSNTEAEVQRYSDNRITFDKLHSAAWGRVTNLKEWPKHENGSPKSPAIMTRSERLALVRVIYPPRVNFDDATAGAALTKLFDGVPLNVQRRAP